MVTDQPICWIRKWNVRNTNDNLEWPFSIICNIKSFSIVLKKEKWSGGQCPTDEEVGQNADQMFFYVPLVNIPFVWRRYHNQGRSAQIKDLLDANGLRIWRDINRVVLLCHGGSIRAISSDWLLSYTCTGTVLALSLVLNVTYKCTRYFFLSETLFIRILYYNY